MDLPEPCFADRLEASPLSSNAVLHPRKALLSPTDYIGSMGLLEEGGEVQ